MGQQHAVQSEPPFFFGTVRSPKTTLGLGFRTSIKSKQHTTFIILFQIANLKLSSLDSKSRTQLFYVCQINLQRVHQAYARAEQTCQHVEISRVNLFVLQIKLVRVLTTCLQH